MVDPLSGRTAPEHTRIRVLGALVLEASLSKLGFGLLGFALPLYARSFGMSVSSIGVLLSTNLIVAAACKPIVGGLVDRVGHARAALIASTARVAVFVLLLLAPGPTLLWAAQLLRGLAKSVRDPALNALVATNGGKKTMATAFAWYGTAKSVASSAGKALAGVVLGAVAGYTTVFALGLLLAAAATATIATRRSDLDAVPNPVEPPEPQDGSGPGRPECAAISSRHIAGALLPWLAFGGAVSATARMLHGLLPLLAVEYAGLSTAVAGSIYLVPTVVIAVTGPAFGWLGDRVDHRFVLGVRSVANVMSSLIMLVAPSGSGFAAGKAIDAVGNAAFTPAWGALMADAAAGHPHDRARVMAIMTSARDVGTIVGPVLGGLVWGAFGPVALLVIRAVLSAGTEALAVVANRTDDRADDR